ncbi:hypothetical protein DMP05_07230 [Slackia isoflavoniconvertens]|uniref:Uncharacterized protein n=1 Tax=Slackia isoflavoniconvertens TaxID=572010 RepID=A0A3N0IAT9_9ACTN|nr:hypothetical protein DMP05_07230 [Slackia isoflavoniconvertens]
MFSRFAQQSKRNGIQGKRLARLTFAAALCRLALCDLSAVAPVCRSAAAGATSIMPAETAAHASISPACLLASCHVRPRIQFASR